MCSVHKYQEVLVTCLYKQNKKQEYFKASIVLNKMDGAVTQQKLHRLGLGNNHFARNYIQKSINILNKNNEDGAAVRWAFLVQYKINKCDEM